MKTYETKESCPFIGTSLGEASIALTHEEANDPLIAQIPDKT